MRQFWSTVLTAMIAPVCAVVLAGCGGGTSAGNGTLPMTNHALPAANAPLSSASGNTPQVVLSATGFTADLSPALPDGKTTTPAGFWLWSQPSTTNAYGNGGTGNVYFYDVQPLPPLQLPAIVSNVVVSGSTVTEHVVSKPSSKGSFSCDLTGTQNSPPNNVGFPNGVVTFTCNLTTSNGLSLTATSPAGGVPSTVEITPAS